MDIINIEIKLIKPYGKNAKKHPEKQISQVANSIKRFGFVQPLVIDKNDELIIGHCRLLAAQKLGLKEVPCLKVENLSDEEVNSLRIADNKLNESDWDMDLLLPELKLLTPELFDLTGFDKDLLIEPDAKDDVIPENVPSRTKLGDLYELGSHRVLCGDSTSLEAFSSLINGARVGMVFTDPPYGVDYVSRVDKKRRKQWGGIKNDDLSGDNLQTFIRDAIPQDFKGHTYVCCNWQSVKDFFDALGMPNSLIVWDKKSIGLGANYRSQHEFILFYGKLKHRNESNVWSLKRDSVGAYTHPTQKPVELITRALVNSSKDGDIVYDSFLGSGSTLIAAQKTGRICYGMELDPKYVDVIVQRYVNYTGNNIIKLNGKEITWPKSAS